MKTLSKLLLIVMLFCCTAGTTAQPTITFVPSSGTALSYNDVTDILKSYELTREMSFYAIIEGATTIGANAFIDCGVLSIDLGDVITIQP